MNCILCSASFFGKWFSRCSYYLYVDKRKQLRISFGFQLNKNKWNRRFQRDKSQGKNNLNKFHRNRVDKIKKKVFPSNSTFTLVSDPFKRLAISKIIANEENKKKNRKFLLYYLYFSFRTKQYHNQIAYTNALQQKCTQ